LKVTVLPVALLAFLFGLFYDIFAMEMVVEMKKVLDAAAWFGNYLCLEQQFFCCRDYCYCYCACLSLAIAFAID